MILARGMSATAAPIIARREGQMELADGKGELVPLFCAPSSSLTSPPGRPDP